MQTLKRFCKENDSIKGDCERAAREVTGNQEKGKSRSGQQCQKTPKFKDDGNEWKNAIGFRDIGATCDLRTVL